MHALIVGGGIAGLATGIALHDQGWRVTICESVHEIKPLGAGVNVLPHGVSVLADLGLEPAIRATGIATRAIEYRTRFGHLLSADARGVEAGFAHPQISIHRGALQFILRDALVARASSRVLKTGHRLSGFTETGAAVTGHFDTATGPVSIEADVMIGADGFHSATRRQLHPDEGPAQSEGVVMYRGVHEQAAYGDGRTMVIAGNHDCKLVLYPISERARLEGRSQVNWVAETRVSRPRPAAEADWTRQADRGFIAQFAEFQLPGIDVQALLKATQSITVYPMIDRDPLAQWGEGRVTLIGDAAHPMYPIGANGTSQAFMDVDALIRALMAHTDPVAALRAYEAERVPASAQVVLANRQSGPEAVLDIADARLRGPEDRVEDLITPDEAEAVAAKYRRVAGFRKTGE